MGKEKTQALGPTLSPWGRGGDSPGWGELTAVAVGDAVEEGSEEAGAAGKEKEECACKHLGTVSMVAREPGPSSGAGKGW